KTVATGCLGECLLWVIRYRSLRDENRSMSAMPRKRRLAVKASSVAMGHHRTHAPQQHQPGPCPFQFRVLVSPHEGINPQFPNGIVSSVSFVSTTNTARSLAGFVLLAWR